MRLALMEWLAEQVRIHGPLDSARLQTFTYGGEPVRLVDQHGIWAPRGFHCALTIRTTFTPPNRVPPYVDREGEDGLDVYKYERTDPNLANNRKLRACIDTGLPLVWLRGVAKGIYLPDFPVYVREDHPGNLEVAVEVRYWQPLPILGEAPAEPGPERRWGVALTRTRLHQRVFHERVLHAYEGSCSICRLRHRELLDAAHIIPDSESGGDPIVPNGLTLCKLHHAAFDANLLGISPDYRVRVREEILREEDGPMLLHGLKEIHGSKLAVVPRERRAKPDPERLDQRFQRFLASA
ncbi:MAG: HNH endonuclease [Actinomycetota bacterium]|nr:HNH endonuclease [Actinomycetota bacterium]